MASLTDFVKNWEAVVMSKRNKKLENSGYHVFRFFHMGEWKEEKIKRTIPVKVFKLFFDNLLTIEI